MIGRAQCYPTEETFSRQQVQERTGIADDVLAFWIKQGLLVPMPAEPRAHRRFSYEQLHIAVVLNAMRSLGANIAVLRKFSAALQDGFHQWYCSELDDNSMRVAHNLSEMLHEFTLGKQVRIPVSPDDWERTGIATSEQEIIQGWLWIEAREGATPDIAEFAKSISYRSAQSIAWARWITEPSFLYREEGSADSSAWIAWIDGEGAAQFADENEDILHKDDGPLAAFFIPLRRLIRRLWPDRLDAATKRHAIDRHNSDIRFLQNLEATDPVRAGQFRKRNGIPENWAEAYHIIEEEDVSP